MAWTYDPSLIATSPRDLVRLLIGDTVPTDPQLQDAELDALLALTPLPRLAAVDACRTLQARYSRQADKTIGTLSVTASQRALAYAALASTLQRRVNATAGMLVGGRLISEKLAARRNLSVAQPMFDKGQWDMPAALCNAWYGFGDWGGVPCCDGAWLPYGGW